MYLDFAENMAKRGRVMKMEDWVGRLNAFLQFNEYEILEDLGSVSAKIAKQKAHKEYEKFRVIQDKEYTSDFDETVSVIKETGKIPDPPHERFSVKKAMEMLKERKQQENLSDFNQKLKKGLEYDFKKDKRNK